MRQQITLCAILAGLTSMFGACRLQPSIPAGEDPQRWAEAITAFEEEDSLTTHPKTPVVFIGSSSIRFWKSLTEDMAPLPIIQRGFGGSRLFDAIYYADRIIIPYKPAVIVAFTGTNDIGPKNTKSASEVLTLFERFVSRLREDLPGTPICYIAISPTQKRLNKLSIVLEANRLISAACASDPSLHFIDTATALLDADGKPDARWFRKDKLHLNAQGYASWTRTIKPLILKLHAKAPAR